MRDSQTGLKIAAVAIPAALALLFILRSWGSAVPGVEPQIAELRTLAADKKWKEVIAKSDALSTRYPPLGREPAREAAALREAAERNVKLAPQLKETGVAEFPQQAARPDAPATDVFKQRYPAGRATQNLAVMSIEGTGTNQRWFLQGSANFVLQMRAEGVTRVVSNNGNQAIFRIQLKEVSQSLVYGRQTLELKLPEGSLIPVVDRAAKIYIPGYAQFREAIRILEQVDPGLVESITVARRLAKEVGIDLSLPPPKDFGALAELQRFSGQEFEVEFIRDVGVTKITVLNGKTLPPELLAQFAHRSSLLLDFYIYPVEEKQVGDHWDVNVTDVAGLVGAGYNATAEGKLTLTRLGNPGADAGLVLLGVSATKPIVLNFEESDGDAVQVGLTPGSSGEANVEYSLQDRLARSARVQWDVNLTRVPSSLLLAGTSNIQATCKSVYLATPVQESSGAK